MVGGDGYFYYLDYGGGFIDAYLCQNIPDCILKKMCRLLYICQNNTSMTLLKQINSGSDRLPLIEKSRNP